MKKLAALFLGLYFAVIMSGCNTEFISSEFSNTASEFMEIIGSSVKGDDVVTLEFSDEYAFPPEYSTSFSALDEGQKGIYKTLFAAAEQMPEGFVKLCKYYNGVMSDIALAYNALLSDCADIFWMPNTYILGEVTEKGEKWAAVAFKISDKDNKNDYLLTKPERDSMRKELEKAVAAITAKADGLADAYAKEKFFNDYICENTEYVLEGKLVHTAYGSLVQGKALCEGYSRAFKLLCNAVGIECDLVSGTVEKEGHMWNVALIDGEYSYVDVTWNDREDSLDYLYFNITYNQLISDHTLSPVFSALTAEKLKDNASYNFKIHKCNYEGNSYFAKNGYILGEDFAFVGAEIITGRANEGYDYATFQVKNGQLMSTLSVDDTSMIGDIQRRLKRIEINSYLLQRDVLVLYFD